MRKGLGRAYLYVKENGDRDIQDDLLCFCLNDARYDSQCEDSRAEWLVSLIDLTGNQDFYFPKIIDALPEADGWDALQIFILCGILAGRGMNEARSAVYKKFDSGEVCEYTGGEVLIEMDGIAGLSHAARYFGNKLLADKDDWDNGHAFNCACEKLGESAALTSLRETAQADPLISIYLERTLTEKAAKANSESQESSRERFRKEYPLEKILANIEECKGKYPGSYMRFGKNATPEEIDFVFEKLLAETRVEQLIRYLWIFRKIEVPVLHDRLFQIASSSDTKTQRAAISALRNSHAPEIRQLGIDLVSSKESTVRFDAIELFINNYEPGNQEIILSALRDIQDIDTLHGTCMDVIRIFENHNDLALNDCMLWVYENTPCSTCRKWSVELLDKHGLLPDKLLHECQFDCDEDTRKLAKTYLEH